MKVTITTDDGEVLSAFQVVEKLPDDYFDDVDITDTDEVLDIEGIEQKYWMERGVVDSKVLTWWKAGRR